MTTETIFLDAFNAQDVFGFGTIGIRSNGSVSTTDSCVNVYFLNEPFDREFVSDFTLALKNLRDRLESK